MQTKFVTVVTMMYNKYQLTHELLFGLFKHEHVDQVIIVDDGSTEQSAIAGLALWENDDLLPVRVLRHEKNLGFTLSANDGLKLAVEARADNHIIYLISNDVTIRGKFVEQSAEFLMSPRKHLVGNTLVAHDSGWNKFGDKIFEYLNGHFLSATADGWKELGYFDEAYAPFDFEDVDLSTRAKKLGFKLTPLNSPLIVHESGGTIGYNPEREIITRRNQEYFRKKWTQK